MQVKNISDVDVIFGYDDHGHWHNISLEPGGVSDEIPKQAGLNAIGNLVDSLVDAAGPRAKTTIIEWPCLVCGATDFKHMSAANSHMRQKHPDFEEKYAKVKDDDGKEVVIVTEYIRPSKTE